ncbi:MAG TPA: PA0069 family radical SAM protein [Bdellovibrionales bacterium]|nr:PA0069 family radical SAM protein [Bdellovibrionales bacterium]
MKEFRKTTAGRGSVGNTDNRFEKYQTRLEHYEGEEFEEKSALRTEFLRDTSKSIVAENKSPDIPFTYSVNPYRGCEHGCAYCYARPTHEYLGFSAGLDFESKILVKPEAPRLLREKLMSKSWKGEHITFSGNTDCYQPVERRLGLTRQCLEVCLEFKNPVAIITKNALVTRDKDLYAEFAKWRGAMVFISITTLDPELCGALEPRTSRPESRLRAIRELTQAGVCVGVNAAPMIPGLTDHELPAILKAAHAAGAQSAGFTPVRLPLAVEPLFQAWLEKHRPLRKEKILENIRNIRGGKLNDGRFGSRMRGSGAIAEYMRQMFKITCKKLGLNEKKFALNSSEFSRPGDQLSLL